MRLRIASLAGCLALAALAGAKPVDSEKAVDRDVCAAKAAEEPAGRVAIDPVSGNQVVKATATVGVDKAGNVYFFENAKNLKQFAVPLENAGSTVSCTQRPSHPRR